MYTAPEFVQKWSASGAAESANAQSFTNDLCELLGVAKPDPKTPDPTRNRYVFEKTVTGRDGNTKFIDCYKRGHFVLENKQGADDVDAERDKPLSSKKAAHLRARKKGHGKRGTKSWDVAMERARKQAENYAHLLAGDEIAGGRPPFLLVADVGHSIALYADWSRAGGYYQPFPDPNNYRIPITELHREELRERLRLVWTDPLALDPARRSARVTKEIADRLARLAKSMETDHAPEAVAGFLMRCLFTMFAEDVKLLPERAFTELLDDCRRQPESFQPLVTELWQRMDKGGFSTVLRQKIRHFNGGLFADTEALPLNEDQIQLLVEAAEADWKEVEPAIFGTLLERALSARDRHKLGAHYTPRAYVERLVQPTVLDPLRAEWESVQAAALSLTADGKDDRARAQVRGFLQRLADLRVLDPACGSGNFLYVTLELLKRLEGEVRNVLAGLGEGQVSMELAGVTVTPQNMLGIELNPRAAAIAELVLWIGFLRWQIRSSGSTDLGEPLLRDYHNIENRDAVLAYERAEDLLNENGEPVTRWDGVTMKVHPITGQEVPDEGAVTRVQRYVKPQAARWPRADYIVGNPPFIGTARMRDTLGDGYTEAVRSVYGNVPDSADFVMFWWDKAAELVREGKTERFGLITTNSIRQTFNRRVIQHHFGQKKPLSLSFAIPDHPWVDSADGAAVRIAMTVGVPGEISGRLLTVLDETEQAGEEAPEVTLREETGKVQADLTVGADVAGAESLLANGNISSPGVKLHGSGFIINKERAKGFGYPGTSVIREYRNGRDLTASLRDVLVIDFYGLSTREAMENYPEIYQHVVEHVKPERDVNRNKAIQQNWWLHGRTRGELRDYLTGLTRYIATVETSKHRFFVLLDKEILPDNKLINIALEDAYFLGVLSSSIHVAYAMAAGSWLGVGNDSVYAKTRCFETFPFPVPTDAQKQAIRDLAERLDAHRKRQQARHPKLTMTGMYNVLERERAGEPLTDKERNIHEWGLVSVLRQLHDELDAAVAAAYGWPADLSEQEILQRLVDLNAERAAEEAGGLVRWLRPDYQAPDEQPAARQAEMELDTDGPAVAVAIAEKRKWPADLTGRATTLRDLLVSTGAPLSLDAVATAFKPKLSKKRREEARGLLDMMVALGQAEEVEELVWRGVG